VLDLLQVFKVSDERKVRLPQFVIFQPNDVPMIPGEIKASLSRKVNDLCAKFDNFVASGRLSTPISRREVPFLSPQTTRPSYAVILKNPPKEKQDASSRKGFLDTVYGSYASSILELKPRTNDWKVVVNDKHTVKSLVQAMKNNHLKGIKCPLKGIKCPSFIGIVQHVPSQTTEEEVRNTVTGCLAAARIGPTRSFKLEFESKESLMKAIQLPPGFGYEKSSLSEYKFLRVPYYN